MRRPEARKTGAPPVPPGPAQPAQTPRKRPRATEVDTDLLELSDSRIHEPQRVAASGRGMVSTAHYSATAAGVRMLERGGNAVDAAVAAALALGVCEPAASGLGGQTMMLIHLRGRASRGENPPHTGEAAARAVRERSEQERETPRPDATGLHLPAPVAGAGDTTVAVDGSSRAPHRAVIDGFADLRADSRRGHLATTVPSSVATYAHVLERYGRLDWATVLEPAIELADGGYEISVLQHRLTKRERRHLQAHSAGPLFLQDGRRAHRAGTRFVQPALAGTLRRLAEQGSDDFYLGETARLIHDDMEANGGILRQDDLAQIPVPVEREPLPGRLGRDRVLTMPLPGAGRTLLEMLNIHQSLPRELQDIDTPEGAVCLAETIRQALIDRQDRPFDPNLYSQASDKQMLDRGYARQVAGRIAQVHTRGETTHLSVMDRDRNVVALTQSIENVYGSCAASRRLGFLYNNYMSAFNYTDPSHPYYLRPNAVPWASVAPTIVFRGGAPRLAIGSPGSERIPPTVLQVLLRLRDSSPLAAVSAPRIHCSLEGVVSAEAARIGTDVLNALEGAGFELNRREPYSFYMGCVQMVMADGDRLVGVADPRRDGAAAGPDPLPAAAR